MYQARLQTMRDILRMADLTAIALIPGPNLTFMTGLHFHLSERPVVIFYTQDKQYIILPALEASKLESMQYPIESFTYTDETGPAMAFQAAITASGIDGGRLGVEGLVMRFFESQMIAYYAPQTHVFDAMVILGELRMRKDEAAVNALRKAINVSQDALMETLGNLETGMTESQIANALKIAMLGQKGCDGFWPPIVLSGPNSALPHGSPGERALTPGDLLLIDYGAAADGYYADITRTYAYGDITEQRLIDAYAAVLEANEAGRNTAGPGVPCQEVDRATRAVIEKAGFGAYFRHRTGHGLGMDIHEAPYIKEGNTDPLEVGNVFTVEPGIYLMGVGGIRIEDDVIITEDGAESLTTLPRELHTLPVS